LATNFSSKDPAINITNISATNFLKKDPAIYITNLLATDFWKKKKIILNINGSFTFCFEELN